MYFFVLFFVAVVVFLYVAHREWHLHAQESQGVLSHTEADESGQLLLSELKSRPGREPTYPAVVDRSAQGDKPVSSEQSDFPAMIYLELKRNTGNYTVCQKDLCCHLTYKMSEKWPDEVYALGAFDELHTVDGLLTGRNT